MAGSPALLLLLSLGLCCTGAQGQRDAVVVRFLNRSIIQPQKGQRLELNCMRNNDSWKVSWIRLDKSGNVHFILFVTRTNTTTFNGGERTSPHFEASWRVSTSTLVVKSFRAEDEGIYFCLVSINQVLHISSGQPAFFPGTTTAAPSTLTATNQSSQVTTKDIACHSPDAGTSNKNMLNSTCEVFLWVRVAGTCLLLLTAITIIHHTPPKEDPP
ncbi:LOW QUALITY PROTEIN: T-cell surface glycoprotein CD8 alpha chain-like isoform X2 [Gallus gallus]|uniref:LOW QUALITY PROTEIN: T-cell surface glycoprotein CD8 alpha chain-like isoform X2 n=1 Tax=Gallus gallus TaxID=9031 RepID=UPI001AE23F2E|nr:LOW QUALITY PROTEIN: T-cell surface glycoprotein CD8 alpha chain-like isoform X2 [Gallus gallus]